MQMRQRVLSAVLVVLVWTPGFALAQGGGSSHWLLHDSRGRSPPIGPIGGRPCRCRASCNRWGG